MLHEQGDLPELPCALCPDVVVGELDRDTILTLRLLEAVSNVPNPEWPPPWDRLCEMCGITDQDTFREVWARFGVYRRIMDEHRKLTNPGLEQNGQKG